MASSPQESPPSNSSSSPPLVSAPPPASPPPVPPVSPPPATPDAPPPSSPLPTSPPPSSPPPPASSSPPPPARDNTPSPPPPTVSLSPPPPNSSESSPPSDPGSSPPPTSDNSPPPPPSNNNSPPSTDDNFPPPPRRDVISQPPPPSNSWRPPPQRSMQPDTPANTTTPARLPGNDSLSRVIVPAIVGGGVVIIALLIIWVVCAGKKKKTRYYMDPGRKPQGADPYYNGTTQWNNSPQQPTDHIVKLTPPPGNSGWGPSPANNSSDYSSGFHSGQQHNPVPSPNMGGIGSKSQFSYAELATATSGFSQANLLGQGGFGYVHKGILPDGKEVAVKCLKSGSGQGEREFQAEVEIISRVHHRHLVSLVGYCIADGQKMLVYEFVENSTLEFHLHGKGRPVMDWETRVRIALGSAKGLAYLHEDCHPRIIHRDIKAANILLDFNFEAMVADFGLAKLTNDTSTHVSTRVMGTFGYLAPEYASSGKLTEKSDVFSFGVMLLELITGRKPVDPSAMMEDSLVDWARPLLAKAIEVGNYDELVDPRLENNYSLRELASMVTCAAASVRHSARRRPKMSQIVRALEGNSLLEDTNDGVRPSGNQSSAAKGNTELYDTRAYDADMLKFRNMVLMSSQEFNSSEYGGTSEYGLNPSSSGSEVSKDNVGKQTPNKQRPPY